MLKPLATFARGNIAATDLEAVLLTQRLQARGDVAGVGLADKDEAATAALLLGEQLIYEGLLGRKEAGLERDP
ncbi:MAG: hypothetical protein GY832_40155 [Chloroflexi bacterium]|nr:hypothetical protein [Chloroflexota bacterium]